MTLSACLSMASGVRKDAKSISNRYYMDRHYRPIYGYCHFSLVPQISYFPNPTWADWFTNPITISCFWLFLVWFYEIDLLDDDCFCFNHTEASWGCFLILIRLSFWGDFLLVIGFRLTTLPSMIRGIVSICSSFRGKTKGISIARSDFFLGLNVLGFTSFELSHVENFGLFLRAIVRH